MHSVCTHNAYIYIYIYIYIYKLILLFYLLAMGEETRYAWGHDHDSRRVRELTTKVVSGPASLHFAPYWARWMVEKLDPILWKTPIFFYQLESRNWESVTLRKTRLSALGMTLNSIWWSPSGPGTLGNVGYPIMAINHRSALIQIGSTCQDPNCGPYRTVQSFSKNSLF